MKRKHAVLGLFVLAFFAPSVLSQSPLDAMVEEHGRLVDELIERRAEQEIKNVEYERVLKEKERVDAEVEELRRQMKVLERKISTMNGIPTIDAVIADGMRERARQLECPDGHLTPERMEELKKLYPSLHDEYKARRLNEMACMWKGKPQEPFTTPLLAMLLQENGQLDPAVRGDYAHGSFYAVGLSQHHICYREFEGKKYCFWENGESPMERFEKDWPEFSFNWESQFYHFSDVISLYIQEGLSADEMIYRWNPNEHNRRGKVKRWEKYVELSIK